MWPGGPTRAEWLGFVGLRACWVDLSGGGEGLVEGGRGRAHSHPTVLIRVRVGSLGRGGTFALGETSGWLVALADLTCPLELILPPLPSLVGRQGLR